MNEPLATGVLGVGAMGRHHARAYADMPETDLVGVADADAERAETVASSLGTTAMDWETLRDSVDAVSIAVPTPFHDEYVGECIDHGLPVLVEKPFVKDERSGRELVRRAEEAGVPLQVGHVERFNPAVQTLKDYVEDLNVIAVTAQRLNPPLDREIDDSAVFDLMIHDLDVLLTIVDSDVDDVSSMTTANGRYATAEVEFADGTIGQLAASRVTQRSVRELTVTAEECLVHLDYEAQTVEVHRHRDEEVPNGREKIVERLFVEDADPLRSELRSFVRSVQQGTTPTVSGRDGLRAVALSRWIDQPARSAPQRGDA